MFYIEPGPGRRAPTSPTSGPEIKIGVPQPALNVDMDAHTNVESLSFSFDPTEGRAADRVHPEPAHARPDPDPDPEPQPAAAAARARCPTPLANVTVLKDTAKLNPMQAISRGLAEAQRSQDAVSGTGSLDVLRYGRVLKARGLVGVRGAGLAYDGLYYVQERDAARSSAASSSRASR